MKIGILEPDNFSYEAIVLLEKLGEVELFDSKNDIYDFISNKEILFIRLKTQINGELLSYAKKLRYLCTPTTGLNHVDVEECNMRGIKVISLKKERHFLNTIRATPEHTLGLIIALLRNYKTAFLNEINNVWDRNLYRGYEIYGMNIGIIGLGRVGRLIARYLYTMGANIHYCEIKHKKSLNNRYKLHDEPLSLIQSSTLVVLCADYKNSNCLILNSKEIDALKGKYLVNTARAELTNEAYIVDLALKGHFKGLAVDVILEEQTSRVNLDKLLRSTASANVIITPHIGGATFNSMEKTEIFIANKVTDHITQLKQNHTDGRD